MFDGCPSSLFLNQIASRFFVSSHGLITTPNDDKHTYIHRYNRHRPLTTCRPTNYLDLSTDVNGQICEQRPPRVTPLSQSHGPPNFLHVAQCPLGARLSRTPIATTHVCLVAQAHLLLPKIPLSSAFLALLLGRATPSFLRRAWCMTCLYPLAARPPLPVPRTRLLSCEAEEH